MGVVWRMLRRNLRYLIELRVCKVSDVFNSVESCEEFGRRIVRYSDRVGSCKEDVRRNARYLIS